MTTLERRVDHAAHLVAIEVVDESRLSPDDALRPAPTGPTVAVVGLGYVGLPTSLALAAGGCDVIGIDISESRLDAIRSGAVDLLPTDLERLESTLGRPGFRLTGDPAAAADAEAVLICVPTPVDEHHEPDLVALRAACAAVVRHAIAGQVIILTSTSYVGTTRELLAGPLAARGFTVGDDIFVAFSPERIDPGNTTHPQHTVPRVVGGITPVCARRATAVLTRAAATIHEVPDTETAELTKLYENTFRAVNIALANEFSEISREFDIDIADVVGAAATKPFGFMPFYPGTGVGGHCIPCDPHYLLWQLRTRRLQSPIVEQAMWAIAARPRQIVAQARERLADDGIALRGASILVVGVAYKAGVQDMRESPALEIIARLLDEGADVAFHDPLIPLVRLPDGRELESVEAPDERTYDLIIVNTIHHRFGLGWLRAHPRVLDPGRLVRRLAGRSAVPMPVDPVTAEDEQVRTGR